MSQVVEVYEGKGGGIRVYSLDDGEIYFAENYSKPHVAALDYAELLDDPHSFRQLDWEELEEAYEWYDGDLESANLIACSRYVNQMPWGVDKYVLGKAGREFANTLF